MQSHKANAYLLGVITDLDAQVCQLEGKPRSEYKGIPPPQCHVDIQVSRAQDVYWERNRAGGSRAGPSSSSANDDDDSEGVIEEVLEVDTSGETMQGLIE